MSPYDGIPSYHIQGDDVVEEPDQDRSAFLQRHWGHPLVPLKKKKDRLSADRPVWDPFRTAYEEVTDGHNSFLLKSWRTDLAEPRRYALLRGYLDMTTTVTLPEEPLRDTLAHTFPCPAPRLTNLVQALQQLVAALPSDELIPAYCSADDPHLSFAYLSEYHLQKLARRCSDVGRLTEKERVWDFFLKNQQEEELLVEMRQQSRPCFF